MRNDWQVLRFIFIASVLSIPSQQSAHGQNFGGGGFNQQINNQNLGGAIFANKAPIAPINPNLGNNGPKSFNPALQNFGQIGGANLPRQGGPNSFLMNGPKMGPQAGPNRSFQNGPNSFDRTVNNLVPMSGVNLPVQGQNSFFLPGNNVGPLPPSELPKSTDGWDRDCASSHSKDGSSGRK